MKVEHLDYIEKTVKEKLKNFYLNSDYKEQLAYIFEQMKNYDFSQFNPGVDVAIDKERGIVYINVYPKSNNEFISEKYT